MYLLFCFISGFCFAGTFPFKIYLITKSSAPYVPSKMLQKILRVTARQNLMNFTPACPKNNHTLQGSKSVVCAEEYIDLRCSLPEGDGYLQRLDSGLWCRRREQAKRLAGTESRRRVDYKMPQRG